MTPIVKSKTFWTGTAAVVTGVGLIITGDLHTGIFTIVQGLSTIFLREAIRKATPPKGE